MRIKIIYLLDLIPTRNETDFKFFLILIDTTKQLIKSSQVSGITSDYGRNRSADADLLS